MAKGNTVTVRFDNSNSVASKFLLTSAFYLVVVALVGVLMSFMLVKPGTLPAFIDFVALRGIHLQAIIFGWLSMALMGAIYHVVPRIVKRDLYSKALGNLHYALMHVGIAVVVVTLLMGFNTGREYLEPVPLVAVAVVVIWLIFFSNILMTILKGDVPKFSPALNFILLSILYLGINYLWANFGFWNGVRDNLSVWTFAHNAVNGWFMFSMVGIFYYFIPKMTGLEGKDKPYPEFLSKVHFAFVCIFIPPSALHHLLYAEAPVNMFWKLAGEWTSVGMLIPTFIWFYIIAVSIKNSKKRIGVPGMFVVATMVFYVMNCVQGSSQSIRFINDFTHQTQWVVGHAHLALLGFISFGVFAITYWILGQFYGANAFNPNLGKGHFWLVIAGFLGMFIPLTIAGLIEGSMRGTGADFYTMREAIQGYLWARLWFGLLTMASFVVFLMNIWKVISKAKQTNFEPVTAEEREMTFTKEA
ncbi:cbb3-type cytochrome c oxidase subunit I [Anaerobacillus sp. MEB173]|uniref:cbb3-type cytochrome c oxidase subunit I n=1 Tax=Anaerobacillus sp. MEB173 TaxID=3383345 RepID=UPI003F8DA1D3